MHEITEQFGDHHVAVSGFRIHDIGFSKTSKNQSIDYPFNVKNDQRWMIWGPPYFKKAPNALLGGELPTNPFSRLVHPTVISVN